MTVGRYLRLRFEKLFRFVFWSLNLIYSFPVHRKVQQAVSFFYSQWIIANIKEAGKGILFFRPVELVGGKYISIGNMTKFGHHCVLTAWEHTDVAKTTPKLVIGTNCDFGEYNHISCANTIIIGNGVLSGRWVTIVDNSHGDNSISQMKMSPASRPIFSKGIIKIGDNVWLGDKVTILPEVEIGEGSIIAANSVVTHDIPSFSIAAGCPAKVIKSNT